MYNNCRLAAEDDLTPSDHTSIQSLLVAAFPQYTEIFAAASYWGARPAYRLWLEAPDGRLAAHLDFEPRIIGVGSTEILVAGVGEVATHPAMQRRGLGRQLMRELFVILRATVPVAFGFLQCREAVVGFYTAAGWQRVPHQVREIDPDTGKPAISDGPTLILPAQATYEQWPTEGIIDLRGMPW